MSIHESFNIYQEIKYKNNFQLDKYLKKCKDEIIAIKSLKRDDLTEMEIKTLEINQESIVSLLKREIIEKINQIKF